MTSVDDLLRETVSFYHVDINKMIFRCIWNGRISKRQDLL